MAERTTTPTYRDLFAIQGFRRLAIGGLLGRLGDQMWQVAMVLFVLQRFHSPTLAGVTLFLAIFPGLIASPVAGALLDRHGRSRLISADYFVVGLSLGLLVGLSYAGLLSPAVLLPIVTLSSLTSMLSTGGQRSLVPLLLPREHWDRGNALDSTGYNATSIVGPAIAGSLVGFSGGEIALLTTAGLYFASSAIFIGLPEPAASAPSPGSIWRSALAALAFVVRNPTLRGVGVALFLINVGGGLVVVSLPVLVLTRLHGTPAQVGLIWAAQGAAGIVAGLIYGRRSSEGRERWTMAICGIVGAGGWVAIVLAPSVIWVAVAIALAGASIGPFDVALFSIRQRRIPVAWFGRAFAISMSLNFAGFPIGSALAGPAVHAWLPLAFLLAGAVSVLGGIAAIVLIPKSAGESN